jgi:hypothetical protein
LTTKNRLGYILGDFSQAHLVTVDTGDLGRNNLNFFCENSFFVLLRF